MFGNRCSENDDASKRDVPSFIEPRPPLIQNPFMRPKPQKGTNLLDLFEEDSDLEDPELVQVYLRLKPCKVPNTLYEVRSDKCLITSLDTTTAGHGRRTQHNVSKMYSFSKIFGPQSTQKEIFEQVVKDNLKKLPDGHSFTLLTYGASGSGKTYTLMGTVGCPGLVPRSLEYVFKLVDASQQPSYKPAENGAERLNLLDQDYELQWVNRLRHISAPLRDKYRRMSVQLHSDLVISSSDLYNRDKHYLWVSFVEIYNEAIYDLLAPPEKRTKLRIREDSSGHVYVKGATQAFVRSGEEAYDVMVAGRHNLVVAATGIHAQSSRSHCIFTITMLTETEGGVRTSCVRLCDLAGCERARATRNTGARMQESRAINSSLHVLERCLHMLRQKQRNRNDALVPYRESKLTRLLGTGLSGAKGEAVSIVVTLNPSPEYAHETKHVLSLATVAQDIQINNTTALITTIESSTQETTINCSADVMKLRADNELLHFELIQAHARNKELLAAMEEKQQVTANTMRELVEEAKDLTRQYYQAQLDALRTQMNDTIEEYESKLTTAMTEIALLEEKLTAERLARVRVEREMQHLRTCIEERDERERAIKDAIPTPDVINLSESEYESDDETSDPNNESLEPIFKKDLNKSVLKQNDTISNHTIDNIEEVNEDEDSDDENFQENNVNEKNIKLLRGTYFISDTAPDMCLKNVESCDKDETFEVFKESVIVKPIIKITEADATIKRSIKSANDNDNSLTQFEQLEKASKNCKSEIAHNQSAFADLLKGKRNYIYNESNKSPDENLPHTFMNKERRIYFDNIDINAPTFNVKVDDIKDTEKNLSPPVVKNDQSVDDVDCKTIKKLLDDSFTQPEIITSVKKHRLAKKQMSADLFESPILVTPRKNVEQAKLNDQLVLKQFASSDGFELESSKGTLTTLKGDILPLQQTKNMTQSPFIKDLANELEMAIDSSRIHAREDVAKLTSERNTDQSYIKKDMCKSMVNHEILKSPVKILSTEELKITTDSIKSLVTIDINKLPLENDTAESYAKKDISTLAKHDIQKSPIKKDSANDFKILSNISDNVIRKVNDSHISNHIPKSPDRKPESDLSVKVDISDTFNDKNNVKSPVTTHTLKSPETHPVSNKPEKQCMVLWPRNDFISKSTITNEIDEIIIAPNEIKKDTKFESSVEMEISIKKEIKLETTSSIDVPNQTFEYQSQQSANIDNTIEEYENIYKDVSRSRTTEFELLASECLNDKSTKNDDDIDDNATKINETKYNLRKRHTKKNNLKTNEVDNDEALLEVASKSERKPRQRCLQLKNRKNTEQDELCGKLKDIINLQTEFSDVTMDVPAPLKVTQDIPSPEKDIEENVPPSFGIQSCPAKSLIRSKRKLFTPRAEPLEESLSQTGDSNERIYVPRPSYHRPRARRKL